MGRFFRGGGGGFLRRGKGFDPLPSKGLLGGDFLGIIQAPLPLRPRLLVKKLVVLVKREHGFAKTLLSLFFQGFLSRRHF